MNKIEILEQYIERMIQTIDKYDENEAEIFIRNITSTFMNEIVNLHEGLTCYYYGVGSYTDDLKILLSKLINYKSNLMLEKEVRDYEIKKLELEKDAFKYNESIFKDYKTEYIDFQKTIENLYEIKEEILDFEEKQKIEDMLSTVELAQNTQNKSKAEEKITNIVNYISSKDSEVILIVLPYLGEVLKRICMDICDD